MFSNKYLSNKNRLFYNELTRFAHIFRNILFLGRTKTGLNTNKLYPFRICICKIRYKLILQLMEGNDINFLPLFVKLVEGNQ